MNEVNKTAYIPLYGKAQVSKKGILLDDKKAEEIWSEVQFPLGRKSKSKWLAYFMSMRGKVFDEWVSDKAKAAPNPTIIHIGCGLDSRILRTDIKNAQWYDVDYEEVISLRRVYFSDTENYHMIVGDASKTDWLWQIENSDNAVILLEGISMYLTAESINNLFLELERKFKNIDVLMDVYTVFGAQMSKYKNPINEVGVTMVYGIDNPNSVLGDTKIKFTNELPLTPQNMIDELKGFERAFFKAMFAGKTAHKMYRLFEYHN